MTLLFYVVEFTFYACVIGWAASVNKRLPRGEMMPEMLRAYKRSFGMEAIICAQAKELRILRKLNRRRVALATRAAQVFAATINQDDHVFHRYWLAATLTTVQLWASRFRNFSFKRTRGPGGRNPTDAKTIEMIVTLKKENLGYVDLRLMWSPAGKVLAVC
jgi:hypothetical protein